MDSRKVPLLTSLGILEVPSCGSGSGNLTSSSPAHMIGGQDFSEDIGTTANVDQFDP